MKDGDFQWWQIESAIGLEANIFKAMDIYTRKSGQKADLVQMNEADMHGKAIDCVGFEVQTVKTVLPGTLFVGRKNKEG